MEYTIWEIAQMVGQYMVIQSSEGGLWRGSIQFVIQELFGEDKETPQSQIKKISKFLRGNGFRHGFVDDEGVWYVPLDADTKKKPLNIKWNLPANVDRQSGPVVVKYICQIDGKTFETKEKLMAHSKEDHDRKIKQGKINSEVESACKICGEKVINKLIPVHYRMEHPEVYTRLVACKICGKKIPASSMGGHIQSHKLSSKSKRLLNLIRENPNLHPREYQKMLGKELVVTSVARSLKNYGYINSSGNRGAIRYTPKDWKPETPAEPVAQEKPEKKKFVPKRKEETTRPKVSSIPLEFAGENNFVLIGEKLYLLVPIGAVQEGK